MLTLLSEVEQLHLTEIAKRTDQSYSAAERHLDDLSQAGIVEERDYGRVRGFKLNLANDRAKLLQEMILKWNTNQEMATNPTPNSTPPTHVSITPPSHPALSPSTI